MAAIASSPRGSCTRRSAGWNGLFLCWVVFLAACGGELGHAVGVNYGMLGDNLPSPKQAVQLLRTTYIDSVKLYTSDPSVLAAFAGTGINLVVGVQNELIPALARSPRAARIWAKQHIKDFYPSTSIVAIAVGNEVLTAKDPSLFPLLVPAMKSLQQALISLGLADKIKISTPNSMAVLSSSAPPSAAAFQPSLMPVIKPMLQFLADTGSSLMANAYPYFAYAQDPVGVSLDYALFTAKQGLKDAGSGLVYGSLFDAQVDAMYYAIKGAGFDGQVPVVVSETGWPSMGEANETGASMQNARVYNTNLVKRLASGLGTPLKPTAPIPTYIFGLFNENQKPGPASERNFGLFEANAVVVYDAGILKRASGNDGEPTPAAAAPPGSQGSTGVWCVAGPGASEEELQRNINFACGEGGADCQAIQPGLPCFYPNALASHASYAMNSYYQRHGRNYWNCFFNSAGLVTATNPSYGSCVYPSQ